jgi:hypothetical protein
MLYRMGPSRVWDDFDWLEGDTLLIASKWMNNGLYMSLLFSSSFVWVEK